MSVPLPPSPCSATLLFAPVCGRQNLHAHIGGGGRGKDVGGERWEGKEDRRGRMGGGRRWEGKGDGRGKMGGERRWEGKDGRGKEMGGER